VYWAGSGGLTGRPMVQPDRVNNHSPTPLSQFSPPSLVLTHACPSRSPLWLDAATPLLLLAACRRPLPPPVLASEALPRYPPPFRFDFFWPRSPAYDPANPSGCWPLLAPPPASPGALAYRRGFPTSPTTSNLLLYAALQLHVCPAATLAVVRSLACSAPLRLRLLHHDDDLAYNSRPFSTSTPSANPSR
jgi:hypothetical protein